MLIKKSKIFKMLIMLVVTLALVSGICLVMPKQSKTVSADVIENSAVLRDDWRGVLASPVTNQNIVSIRITTDSSKITGYTKGENIAASTSNNDLYYYYKLAGYQVNTTYDSDDEAVYSDGYDIVIYANVEKIYAPKDSSSLFGSIYANNGQTDYFFNCKSIIFDNFDTSNATQMDGMFGYSSELTNLDLSGFDASQVTTMQWMFQYCTKLETITFGSNFNTSKVTDMSGMFRGCNSLKNLDLSSFDTSNVTDMMDFFSGCASLTRLNLGNFNTKNVTSMVQMFQACSALTFVNVSSFNTSKVKNMTSMFRGCKSVNILNISNFSFASVTKASNVDAMFGMSYASFGESFGLEGDDLNNFVNAETDEERIEILISVLDGQDESTIRLYFSAFVSLVGGPITIITPSDLNGLTISLAGTYEYGNEGNKVSTDVLVAGKMLTLAGHPQPLFLSANWLAKVTTISPSSISSIKFTSNSSAISGFTKGENVADDSSYEDLYYYCKSSGSGLYDIVVYADTIIYAPDDCMFLFVNQETFEGITNCTSLVFDNFNTSNTTNMSLMFCGCSSLTTLNISSFSFDSVDATDEEATMGMFGMSVAQFGQMLGFEGEELDAFVGLTDEERIELLAEMMGSEEEAQLWYQTYIFSIPKIIAPATIPSDLTISLPGEYNCTGGGDETTSILIAGATHISPNASNDTAETGVVSTSIFFGLIALCFVYAGFMMLRKKKIR